MTSAFQTNYKWIIQESTTTQVEKWFQPTKIAAALPSQASGSRIVLQATIVRQTPSSVETVTDEGAVLAHLSAGQRWTYIAQNNPFEFISAIVAVFVAVYVLVHITWPAFVAIGTFVIEVAHAQEKQPLVLSFEHFGVSPQSFVMVLLALILIWLLGMVSFVTGQAKINFARDGFKQLLSFFIGVATGAVSK
jgi:hypothetical protein